MKSDPTEAPEPAGPWVWRVFDLLTWRLRRARRTVVTAADALTIFLAWQATYLFRLGFRNWLVERPGYDIWVILGIVGVYLAVMRLMGIERGTWRYVNFVDIGRLTMTCLVAGLLSAVAVLMAQLVQIPRAVLALHPVMSLMGLALTRLVFRMMYEQSRTSRLGADPRLRRALVLGAGEAGRLLVAGVQHRGWKIVGFLDDDRGKRGTRVAGVPVLGPLDRLRDPDTVDGISHLVMAMPSATGEQRRRVVELATGTGLPVLTVPSSTELAGGRSRIERVRDIEPEDLLGREHVKMDNAAVVQAIGGKTVLVTGAGGSIGAELCRQIARLAPRRLVLLELSEYALYAIDQELSERFPALPLSLWVGDIKDRALLDRCFAQERPQWVFHAAAYKHVPLMEGDNAFAAVRNNIGGTYELAQAAAASGVERFVLISTDKAVNPTNVMGATKRAAEMVISHEAAGGADTRFVAVRFGNVLGSSGSVIPKFKEQIARGGPVTVTHPEITRYFMTIPEAVQLVLQAGVLAQSGQVFVLDMGEPVKIAELARQMIHLSGHSEDEIPVVFTGLRPGEKLYEELLADADTTLPTAHPRLRIARLSQDVDEAWMQAMRDLVRRDPQGMDSLEVKRALQHLVPEYRPG